MPTISELRTAVADAVATIDGLRATPLVADKVNGPQAVVMRKEFVYDDVLNGAGEFGAHTYQFGITVYVARTNERGAQDLLDEYAEPSGDNSIKAAVETDTDLLALVDWVDVTEVGEIRISTIGQIDYLIEEFTVQVAVSG